MTDKIVSVAEDDLRDPSCSNCLNGFTDYFDGMNLIGCAKLRAIFPLHMERYGDQITDCWSWDRKTPMDSSVIVEVTV